jgi:hypothetical protein
VSEVVNNSCRQCYRFLDTATVTIQCPACGRGYEKLKLTTYWDGSEPKTNSNCLDGFVPPKPGILDNFGD